MRYMVVEQRGEGGDIKNDANMVMCKVVLKTMRGGMKGWRRRQLKQCQRQ